MTIKLTYPHTGLHSIYYFCKDKNKDNIFFTERTIDDIRYFSRENINYSISKKDRFLKLEIKKLSKMFDVFKGLDKLYFKQDVSNTNNFNFDLKKTLEKSNRDNLNKFIKNLSNKTLSINLYEELLKENIIDEIPFTITKVADIGFSRKKYIKAHEYIDAMPIGYNPKEEYNLREYFCKKVINLLLEKELFITKNPSVYFYNELLSKANILEDKSMQQVNKAGTIFTNKLDTIYIYEKNCQYPRKIIKKDANSNKLIVSIFYKNGLLEYKYLSNYKESIFNTIKNKNEIFELAVNDSGVSGEFYSYNKENKKFDEIYAMDRTNSTCSKVQTYNYTKTLRRIFRKKNPNYKNIANEKELNILKCLIKASGLPVVKFESILKEFEKTSNSNEKMAMKLIELNYVI